jgi:hypothetical protein
MVQNDKYKIYVEEILTKYVKIAHDLAFCADGDGKRSLRRSSCTLQVMFYTQYKNDNDWQYYLHAYV